MNEATIWDRTEEIERLNEDLQAEEDTRTREARRGGPKGPLPPSEELSLYERLRAIEDAAHKEVTEWPVDERETWDGDE